MGCGIVNENIEKSKLLSAYKKIFPSCKLDQEGIALYVVILSDVSLAELRHAMIMLSDKTDFFPSVAQIRKQVMEVREVLHPELHVKTADEAWREVMEQMKAAFPYKSPKFSTEEIKETVKTLGWMAICETSTDKLGITRAHFRDTYSSIVQRKRDRKENLRILASAPKGIDCPQIEKLFLPSHKGLEKIGTGAMP